MQSSTTPSNDSNKSGVISDQTSNNPSPISVFQNNDFSQCFEDFHVENINKLCSDLEHLNMKTSKQSAQNFTSPDPDVIIAKQIKFFKRIYEILHSFTSLNNFLIFKYNNNLSLDSTTDKFPFQRFDNFNEFIKKSTPFMVIFYLKRTINLNYLKIFTFIIRLELVSEIRVIWCEQDDRLAQPKQANRNIEQVENRQQRQWTPREWTTKYKEPIDFNATAHVLSYQRLQ